MPTPRKNPDKPRKLTTPEIIMNYFRKHPEFSTTCNPLAVKLKIPRTTTADALQNLSVSGQLHREKIAIPAAERKQGEREFQFEYSLPKPEHTTQRREPEPFKPLSGIHKGFRRVVPELENAPSIISSKLEEPQPAVGKNTGSLARTVFDNSLPDGQAVTQPPKPDEQPVEAGGDVMEVQQAARRQMSMEVELIQEPIYTVRSNGHEIRGMRVTSEWNGLRKLEDAHGRSLIVMEADGPLTAALRESGAAIFGNEGRRCVAVVATPELVLELNTLTTG